MHTFIKIAIVLQPTSFYLFRPSLAHQKGAHNCTKQLMNIFCMLQSCQKFLSM